MYRINVEYFLPPTVQRVVVFLLPTLCVPPEHPRNIVQRKVFCPSS